MSRLCILTSSYPRDPGDNINSGVFVRDFARALAAVFPDCCVFTHRKGSPGHYPDPFDVIEYRWLGRSPPYPSASGAFFCLIQINDGGRALCKV